MTFDFQLIDLNKHGYKTFGVIKYGQTNRLFSNPTHKPLKMLKFALLFD